MSSQENLKEKRQDAEEIANVVATMQERKKLILLGIAIGMDEIAPVLSLPPHENKVS